MIGHPIPPPPGKDKYETFCPNPFGCSAGANPWYARTLFPIGNDPTQCKTCTPDGFAEPPKLLKRSELERHIKSCPMCHYLFGTVSKQNCLDIPNRPTFQSWLGYWHNQTTLNPAKPHQDPCRICGFNITLLQNLISDALNSHSSQGNVLFKNSETGQCHALLKHVCELTHLCLHTKDNDDLRRKNIQEITVGLSGPRMHFEQIRSMVKNLTDKKHPSAKRLLHKIDNSF